MTSKKVTLLVVIYLGMVVGCGDPMEPSGLSIINPVAFSPPTEWKTWYREVEECVGFERPFGAIRWYWADKITWDGTYLKGLWTPNTTIHLLRGMFPGVLERTTKSEMIHFLLQGGREHPEPPFGVCNAVMEEE